MRKLNSLKWQVISAHAANKKLPANLICMLYGILYNIYYILYFHVL